MPNRPLVVITNGEPFSLASRAFRTVGGGSYPHIVFNASVDDVDAQGNPFALLAEALPELNTATWRVSPDGTMETTYHLKPGIVWHDGAPFDAADYVFAWQVYSNPASGTPNTVPIGEMREINAPDSRTVVMRWKRPYPGGAALYSRNQSGFGPLPQHLLAEAYQEGNFEAFANQPFWTQEYVGLGPYRLERWDPGVELDAVGFDRFVLGPPKIERLRILIAKDANAAVASFLSGDVHIALDYILSYEHGAVLQQQWADSHAGTVLFSPLLLWNAVLQFRPDQISTPAMQDVRFRQALEYGMDRKALNDALYGGTAIVTDTLLSPKSSYYSAIEPAITKYPYDPRRAQQLLDETGLQRGADGLYLGTDRQPFSLEIMGRANPTWEAEHAIVVEGYRKIGLNAVGRIIPTIQFGDGQVLASMGSMHLTGGASFERALGRYSSVAISRPETRWQGSNYGGWSNPEYDRLWDLYNSTLELPTQIQ